MPDFTRDALTLFTFYVSRLYPFTHHAPRITLQLFPRFHNHPNGS